MAQYDNCASEYVEAKKDSFRVDVEYYTFLHKMLLPVLCRDREMKMNCFNTILTGKRVLDLACGDGHYTRIYFS